MAIWAIADLHLAISVPEKAMDVFGPAWHRYAERIKDEWSSRIAPDDLVLIPGDITWAMKLDQAVIDFAWIDKLPGTKVMIRGNHDYWWSSPKQIRAVLPPSLHIIQNDVFNWQDVSIGGSRLWDTPEYGFGSITVYVKNERQNKTLQDKHEAPEEAEKIFLRELQRLELSLEKLSPNAALRIAMTHYPPVGLDLAPSRASAVLEKHKVDVCLFGHLHNLIPGSAPFGTARGVKYAITSCDYLNFIPLKIRD